MWLISCHRQLHIQCLCYHCLMWGTPMSSLIKHGYHYYIQLQNEFLHLFENTCCLSLVAYSVTTCWFYWALLWCVIIMILTVSKSHIYAPPQISLSLCYQFKSRYNKLALLALIRLHVLNRWAVASAAKVLSEPGGFRSEDTLESDQFRFQDQVHEILLLH